jgi:RNA-binding protein YlmH
MIFQDVLKSIKKSQVPVTTKFLDPKQQRQIINYFSENEYVLDGGYTEAERKRAYFYGNAKDDQTCIKITTNSPYLSLTHQNILGSLMALSISRESIGDILPKQGLFLVTNEVLPIIKSTFDAIGNHPIDTEIYNGPVKSEIEYQVNTVSLHSKRLDLVVTKICNISRKKANVWIDNEFVKVNHVVETKNTKTVGIDDIISIRKKGRYIIMNDEKRSKKGNIILKYGKII